MIRRSLAAALLIVGAWAAPAEAAAAGTVTGTYTTDAGTPIRGAQVIVYSATDLYQGGGTTDANGRYTVPNITAGSIKIKFSELLRTQYAHRRPDAASATLFTVPDGGTVTVDEIRTPDSAVEGTFTTADGRPGDDVLVGAYSTTNRLLKSVLTGPDGRYRIDPVPAGPVKLLFDRNNVEQWAHQATDFASATTFDAPVNGTLVVDETQIPTGTIRGVISGLTDDLYVTAYRVGGGYVEADVTADGHYSISAPAGQYRVSVDTEITGTQYVPQKTKLDDGAVFTLATGQTLDVDETVLALGSVGGVLKGGNDKRVQLWRGDQVVATGYAYEDGEYLFRGVQPGDYLVSWRNSAGTETYLPGTLHRDEAEVITIRAYRKTTASTRDVAGARLHGRLTLPDGTPAPGVSVRAASVPPGYSYGATTTGDGTWTIDNIRPENYVVSFATGGNTQWAYGQATAADAEVFPLASGRDTAVDDTWRTGSTLRVTAVDAVTGDPAASFCATFEDRPGRHCTDTETLIVPGLAAGADTLSVTPTNKSDYLPGTPVPVTIGSGDTAVTVPLDQGGRVGVQIAERAGGAPAWDFCAVLVAPGDGTPDLGSHNNCTHKNGKITTYAVPAGTYQVFVHSTRTSRLGAQWVGAAGGTGDQKEAVKIKVKTGKTTRLPQVLLDPGQPISGTVRDAAGAPVAGVNVSRGAWPLGTAPPYPQTDANGRYTMSGFGPYEWPLLFTPKDGTPPRQWSGGTGNRFQAATVVPGGVFDYTLAAGSRLTGTVTTDRPFTSGQITAVNTATGDILAVAGFTSANRAYDLPIVGGGSVLLRWSIDGASGSWPDPVSVPKSGTKTVDLTIPGS
ncbi:carboxypeptidase-like regulatory domain-containing protein [Actinoplanes sp. NPDC051470]|uniref:carboxypeptidase-like regulatory domain-containing protein n=1 Tax=Actinoplanes sp. NPDC051470 TaxID=3157224 RepID=UPI00343351C3